MKEQIELALQYARMVWRYRWLALIVAGLSCLGGWAYVVMMPDQYSVSAKVFLDTRSLLRPVLKGLAVDAATDLDTALLMRRTLLVRPNLEAVARKTDLDLTAKTPEAFELLLNRLAQNIKISGTRRDNIFVISYDSHDPQRAMRVVDSLLQMFVEKSLGDTRKDTSKTRQFVERQIAEYEARLRAAEDRLKEFKRRNVGMMPESGSTFFSRMSQVGRELANARLLLQEGKRRAGQIKAQLDSINATLAMPGSMSQPVGQPVDPNAERVSQLEENLDSLLLNYTDKHPDVVGTRRLLEEARADLEASRATSETAVQAQADLQRIQNPVHLQLSVQLSEAQGEVAALEARVAEYERREQELKALIDTMPQIEAELASLDRDYKINQEHFAELVKRREALKLSDEAGQTSDEVRFNVIEPPRVPLVPDGPNRPLFAAMALGAGLGAGVGFALLIALVRPSVYSKEVLAEVTGLPVMGAINRLWTPKERLRRRFELGTYATACVMLIAAYAALLLAFQLEIDIQGRVLSVARQFL